MSSTLPDYQIKNRDPLIYYNNTTKKIHFTPNKIIVTMIEEFIGIDLFLNYIKEHHDEFSEDDHFQIKQLLGFPIPDMIQSSY